MLQKLESLIMRWYINHTGAMLGALVSLSNRITISLLTFIECSCTHSLLAFSCSWMHSLTLRQQKFIENASYSSYENVHHTRLRRCYIVSSKSSSVVVGDACNQKGRTGLQQGSLLATSIGSVSQSSYRSLRHT